MSIPPAAYVVTHVTKCVGGGGRKNLPPSRLSENADNDNCDDHCQQGPDPVMRTHVQPCRAHREAIGDAWTLYTVHATTVEPFLSSCSNCSISLCLLTDRERRSELFFRKRNHWFSFHQWYIRRCMYRLECAVTSVGEVTYACIIPQIVLFCNIACGFTSFFDDTGNNSGNNKDKTE